MLSCTLLFVIRVLGAVLTISLCHPGARPSLYHPVAINVCHPVRFFFLSSWVWGAVLRFLYHPVAINVCHPMRFFLLSSWVWDPRILCHPGCGVPVFFVILGLDPRIQVL